MSNRGIQETLNAFILKDYLENLEAVKRTVKRVDTASRIKAALAEHSIFASLSKEVTSRYYTPALGVKWLKEIPKLEAIFQEIADDNGYKLGSTNSHGSGYSFNILTDSGPVYVSVNITGNPHCHIIKKEREPSPYDYDNVVVCN